MLEKLYKFTFTDSKSIERIINDDNLIINHMTLAKGDSIPEHRSDSNVYILVIRGNLTLKLDTQEDKVYPAGSIITYRYGLKMSIFNHSDDILEFFVIKAPNPKNIII